MSTERSFSCVSCGTPTTRRIKAGRPARCVNCARKAMNDAFDDSVGGRLAHRAAYEAELSALPLTSMLYRR